MVEERRIVHHQEPEDKVPGYLYNPQTDKLKLSKFSINADTDAKRSLLSVVLRVFDPLSIFSPVIIRGRLLIRKLWRFG